MPAPAVSMATGDAELAHATVQDLLFPGRPLRFAGCPGDDFRFTLTSVTAGGLSGDRVRHSMSTVATVPPPGFFMAATALRGSMGLDSAGEQVHVAAGGSATCPERTTWDARWDDIDVAVVRVPTSTVERAAEVVGIGAGDLHFEGMAPVSEAAGRQWRRLASWVHRELHAADSSFDSPVVAARAADLVATAALVTFPNTAMTVAELGGPGYVAPASVRRAMAFMDAHAAGPVELTDVAAAAGVGPRALQHAFRRHEGTTPLGYLRRTRLDGAHRHLQDGDPTRGDTVTAIAARWGFPRTDRFSAAYRRVYGTSPGHTLRT